MYQMYIHCFREFYPRSDYYRPQLRWGKVIFSVACVKNAVHRGEYLGRYTAPGRYTPLGRYTPPGQVPPLLREDTPAIPMVSERAVRILLECILVVHKYTYIRCGYFPHSPYINGKEYQSSRHRKFNAQNIHYHYLGVTALASGNSAIIFLVPRH